MLENQQKYYKFQFFILHYLVLLSERLCFNVFLLLFYALKCYYDEIRMFSQLF